MGTLFTYPDSSFCFTIPLIVISEKTLFKKNFYRCHFDVRQRRIFIMDFCASALDFCARFIIILHSFFCFRSLPSLSCFKNRSRITQRYRTRNVFLFAVFRYFCRRLIGRMALWRIWLSRCVFILRHTDYSLASYCVFHEKPAVFHYI